ncbi:MAG: cytochrome c family protein [Gammaproteobacteria bacterium]|nr:cytochrome c family protein [Gammaproteobacteria bacterium]MCF6231369.1 cytochrome c family protein [Gammaproteobacteria bacterium]
MLQFKQSMLIALGCLYLLLMTACNSSPDKSEPVDSSVSVTEQLEFELSPLSSGDPTFTSEHFSGSTNCVMCHDGLSDEAGNDVSIVTDWSSTMMANATRDPFWLAKVRSELNRNPQLAELINDKCTRCHAPMANEEIRRSGNTLSIFDDGFLSESHPRHDAAMDAVSCTLCHQITDNPQLGTADGFSGHFEINEAKTIYGPYDNVYTQPMINHTGYTPTYSTHVQKSELCATCHELKTPYVDGSGAILSQTYADEFPEQTPYSEWLHSDYAELKSCQDCHMSRTDGVIMATRPRWLTTQRDNFALHDFIGANKMMLDIFDKNRDQLGILSNNFAETIAKTETMLSNAASIQRLQSSLVNGQLGFTLKIESQTGHKLPSGYPSRRVVLHVTVRDSGGDIVFESGRPNENGSVEGLDADSDLSRYELHHDLITSADQVQVYEAIMGNSDEEVNYTLLRSMKYLKDNRILPTGFNKETVPNDVAVKGHARTDPNFIGGSDQISYRIDGLPTGSYTITAELLYQTLSYAFGQDLFQDSSLEVADFEAMYSASTFKFVPMTKLQFQIP